MNNINRRHAQILADSIFPQANLARENRHALWANRFLKRQHSLVITSLVNNTVLCKQKRIIDREAIGVFLPASLSRERRRFIAGVGWQKGMRPSGTVGG